MNQKHIIVFNPKGGVGKSTLCERIAMELIRLGYSVSVENIDQQVHVELVEHESAEFCLYDTMGAYRAGNMDLLKAASGQNPDDVLIIVPTGTGKNDFKDLDFLKSCLEENNLVENSIFVFTKVRKNSVPMKERKELLNKVGLRYTKYSMPLLEDFSEERDTTRTRNEISQLIHEVIL